MRLKAVACVSLVPIFVLGALSGSARAQTAQSGSDKVAAEALFEDARKLAAAGKYADACPKFADSERLDPSPSTLLNLANCWEKVGRTATAWATYREAESAANAAKRQDYMATAQRHADALAPKLARSRPGPNSRPSCRRRTRCVDSKPRSAPRRRRSARI